MFYIDTNYTNSVEGKYLDSFCDAGFPRISSWGNISIFASNDNEVKLTLFT